MRTKIRMTSTSADTYTIRLTPAQHELICRVVSFIHDLGISEESIIIQTGETRQGIQRILSKLNTEGQEVSVSLTQLHTVHASLTVAWNQILSEEEFWRRIGFFRENVIDLAQGLATAVSGEGEG